MKRFFQSNIDNRGRLVRGISGLLLAVGGVIAGQYAPWAGIALVLVGAFVLFEAVRGWCLMRACGLRTRL